MLFYPPIDRNRSRNWRIWSIRQNSNCYRATATCLWRGSKSCTCCIGRKKRPYCWVSTRRVDTFAWQRVISDNLLNISNSIYLSVGSNKYMHMCMYVCIGDLCRLEQSRQKNDAERNEQEAHHLQVLQP